MSKLVAIFGNSAAPLVALVVLTLLTFLCVVVLSGVATVN